MGRTKDFSTFSDGQIATNITRQALYAEKGLLVPKPNLEEVQRSLEWITAMTCELHSRLENPGAPVTKIPA